MADKGGKDKGRLGIDSDPYPAVTVGKGKGTDKGQDHLFAADPWVPPGERAAAKRSAGPSSEGEGQGPCKFIAIDDYGVLSEGDLRDVSELDDQGGLPEGR